MRKVRCLGLTALGQTWYRLYHTRGISRDDRVRRKMPRTHRAVSDNRVVSYSRAWKDSNLGCYPHVVAKSDGANPYRGIRAVAVCANAVEVGIHDAGIGKNRAAADSDRALATEARAIEETVVANADYGV